MDRVISFKSWFGAVFRKWRWMLVIALVLGCLLGGREAMSIRASRAAAREAAQQNTEDESTRQARSVYNEAMSEMDDIVSRRNDYIVNSLKTRIDPTAEGKATVNLYVTTDALNQDNTSSIEEIQMTNSTQSGTNGTVEYMTPALRKANQILDGYMEFVKSEIDWSSLAEKLGTKEEYIRELVTTNVIDESNVKLTISVIHPDEDGAGQIMNELIDQVNAQKDVMTEKFGQHEIEFRNLSVNTVVDTTLMRWLSDRVSDVNTLIVAQDNYKVNMSSTQQQTTVTEQSRREILVSCAKKGLVGFFGGLIVFILIYGIYLIASKKVLSGKDLNDQYEFRKLAAVPDGKLLKKRGLDRLAVRPALSYYTGKTEEAAYKIAGETLGEAVSGGKIIGIVGDPGRESLEQVCKNLNAQEENPEIRYLVLDDLSQNPDSLAKLKECESAIVVAKLYNSRYNRIDEILEVLKTYQKKVAGSIII